MNTNRISEKKRYAKPLEELRGHITYMISIPQIGITAHGLEAKTDLVDWSVLGYIRHWQSSAQGRSINVGGKIFTWINYTRMMHALPILKIKDKHAISRRIKKLEKLGVLETYHASDNSLYMRLTDLALAVYDFKLDDVVGDAQDDSHTLRRAKAWKNYPPDDNDPAWRLFNEKFWRHYPKTYGKKKDAWVEWYALNPDGQLAEIIAKGIDTHKATRQWENGFIPYPNKFLSGRFWEAKLENDGGAMLPKVHRGCDTESTQHNNISINKKSFKNNIYPQNQVLGVSPSRKEFSRLEEKAKSEIIQPVASVQPAEHSGDDGYVPQDRAGEILKRPGFQPKPDQGEPKAKPRCNATTSLLRQELAKCRLTPEERALVDAELDTMRKRKPNLVGGALH